MDPAAKMQWLYGFLQQIVLPIKPTAMATIPPINNHIERSVGLPEKKRDTSELNESIAFTPNTTRMIPPTIKTIDIRRFMLY